MPVALYSSYKTMWIVEPQSAERIFERYVTEHALKVVRNEWLDRGKGGVVKKDGRIKQIRTLSGKVYKGKMFIDATYEGDLMAAAGVTYTVGREPNSQYGEIVNGAPL